MTFSWRREAWLGLTLVALFAFLGTRGLNEPDEGRYAEIGREMAATGQWLVPHLNGIEHFQKPPFVYWLTALSIRLLGANEWGARLPSALAALGTIMMTRAIARRVLEAGRAETAALVLLSSLGFFALARLLTPDMTLTFWTTAAIAAFVWERRWWFFVCLGLGFMTKGPMALVVPLGAVLGWHLAARGTPARRRLPWLPGMLLTLALGLGWFVALSVWDHRLFSYFGGYELVERFGSHKHGRSQPFWFFGPVILGAFLPWTFFAFAHVKAVWRKWRTRTLLPWQGMLLGWLLVSFVILSASGSKLPTYILPLLPALALGLAAKLPRATAWKVALPAVAFFVVAAALMPLVNQHLEQEATVRELVQIIRAQPGSATAPVFTCAVRAHGVEFYLRRGVATTEDEADVVLPPSPVQQARLFESPGKLEAAFAGGPPAYGVIRSDALGKKFPPTRWQKLGQAGDFLLITNRPPP